MTSRRGTGLRWARRGGGDYEHLLTFDDISLSFGAVQALGDVSFHVDDGELFAIIGPNGAGKTSTFNCINGVYKPQEGSISWKGELITGQRPDKVASLGIARTFQNIELFAHMTVLENISTGQYVRTSTKWWQGAVWFGPAKKEEMEVRARVEDIIELLEIEAWRSFPVGMLPYGIQKRVELGRALAMEPELLLLDEPVAGMNLEETEDMARFILDIRNELGIANRVLVLDFGEVIAQGTPDVIQEDEKVIRAYLGEDLDR